MPSPGPGQQPAPRRAPVEQSYQFGGWRLATTKSHILTSEEAEAVSGQFELPHLPDMLFTNNKVELTHRESGASLRFLPLEALRLVNAREDLIRVSYSASWLASRSENPHHNKIAHPYDWTYTTNYKGTVDKFQCEPTDLQINYEKLKIEEKMLFYDEVVLYEDELDDNGCTKLSVKLRVMPSGFFLLQRFYLRVDATLVRVHDTRVYHEVENNYVLREYSEREDKLDNLTQLPRDVLISQDAIVNHLPVKMTVMEKMTF